MRGGLIGRAGLHQAHPLPHLAGGRNRSAEGQKSHLTKRDTSHIIDRDRNCDNPKRGNDHAAEEVSDLLQSEVPGDLLPDPIRRAHMLPRLSPGLQTSLRRDHGGEHQAGGDQAEEGEETECAESKGLTPCAARGRVLSADRPGGSPIAPGHRPPMRPCTAEPLRVDHPERFFFACQEEKSTKSRVRALSA